MTIARNHWRVGFAAIALGIVLLLAARHDVQLPAFLQRITYNRPLDNTLDFTHDTLPNGVQFYVRHHRSASERTELRLAVDAGAIQEDPDQRGLAHAVEHMLFRGTKTFPHESIERYLESLGMRGGDDINAATGFDQTIYRVAIPDGRLGAIDTALAMLASMAHEATFRPEDANPEAGVVLAEWRQSALGEETRRRYARDSLLFDGTPYLGRHVIGDTAILHRFDVRAMRRHYEKWYRPERMAIVAVGEFYTDSIQALIKHYFGAIPASATSTPRATRVDTLPQLPGGMVTARMEGTTASIGVWHREPRNRYRTRGDYRNALIHSLWSAIVGARLDDAAEQADSPLSSASVDDAILTRDIAADVVSATAMPGKAFAARDVVTTALRELAWTGPTEAELNEVGRGMLHVAANDAQLGENSANVADLFVQHFLAGKTILTNEATYDLIRDLIPTITPRDIQAYASSHTGDSAAVVVVSTNATDSAVVGPTLSVANIVQQGRTRAIAAPAPVEPVDLEHLLASRPTAGKIVSEADIPGVNGYDWTLSNGMHVLLASTTNSYEEVQLRAVAPGGASLADDRAYASAYLSDKIIEATGVGRWPGRRLQRALAGTSVGLGTTVSDDDIVLDGHASPDDLETLFQLFYLTLTQPRRDTVAFERYRARTQSFIANRGSNPDAVFEDSLDAALAPGDRRALRNDPRLVTEARLYDALDFWKRRAANGSNFTVALVGNFTFAQMRPLIERYLASLPRGNVEHPRERPRQSPALAVHRTLNIGTVDRARTAIAWIGPNPITPESQTDLSTVRELADRAINDRLREQLGGIYSVDVSLGMDLVPPARYTITVDFQSAPGQVDALARAAIEELHRLKKSGPTAAEFASARESLVRDHDADLDDDNYWVNELTSHARLGWPFASISTHAREFQDMTLEHARAACALYLPADDYVRVTLLPRS